MRRRSVVLGRKNCVVVLLHIRPELFSAFASDVLRGDDGERSAIPEETC